MSVTKRKLADSLKFAIRKLKKLIFAPNFIPEILFVTKILSAKILIHAI
jgi:hypothetical protein